MPVYQHNPSAIQEKLEHRILHGLSCEWETALWVLDEHHKNLMTKPLFSLKDLKSKLGHWSPQKREICLSRSLVMNHPWDAVRDVLLHEMAHQMADQALGTKNEPPHGPTFKKACRLLRANAKASGNHRILDEQISHSSDSVEDKRLRRIKKLMALAESQNQHEAEAAMVKAHELIEKYNIDLFAKAEKRNFISIFLGKPALRHTRNEYHLARLLQEFYFIEGMWVSAYVLEKGKMGQVMEITGTKPNIKIAAYVYHFIRNYIQYQWKVYNIEKKLNQHRKTDFAIGVIEGFRSKLKSKSKKGKVPRAEKALLRIGDPLLKKHMIYKYPHTTRFSRNVTRQDDIVLSDGVSIGKSLVISKGISSTGKSSRVLPETHFRKKN